MPLDRVLQKLGEKFAEDVPVMDGGVYDNQKMDSIENINDHTDDVIDLFIISDTDPRNAGLLASPRLSKVGRLSLSWFYRLVLFLQLGWLLTPTALLPGLGT